MSTERICKGCGVTIWQEPDKALDGTYAVVWASEEGWVCPATGNEHEPEGPDSVYSRDLFLVTEGTMPPTDDDTYNAIVDAMENKGHSRVRVERDLREWIENNAEDDESPMDPVEALTYAILAINTDQAPDATSGNDLLYLELNAERALTALAALRDMLGSE